MASMVGDGDDLLRKQKEFLRAIERYESVPVYKFLGFLTSSSNVAMQVWLLVRTMGVWSGLWMETAAFLAAILVADFVNGVVHLAMDHASGYSTPVGPFIANFHMHHRIPVYRRRNLFVVYFRESGSKFWLVAYLAVAVWAAPAFLRTEPAWAHFLVWVGCLSSWAEVSHYMCHTTDYGIQGWLERSGIVLSKSHHSRHHVEDNLNYAFLNGWTDPVLNRIAKICHGGYKRTTDLHDDLYEAEVRS